MKFRFKTQQYQVDAVNSIVDVFKGQPYQDGAEYTRDLGVRKAPERNEQISIFDFDSDGNIKPANEEDAGIINREKNNFLLKRKNEYIILMSDDLIKILLN